MEEQKLFQNVTSKIAASVTEVTETNILSMEFLNTVSVIFYFGNLWIKDHYFPYCEENNLSTG